MPRNKSAIWEAFVDKPAKHVAACKFCKTKINRKKPERMRAHIKDNCVKCPDEDKRRFLHVDNPMTAAAGTPSSSTSGSASGGASGGASGELATAWKALAKRIRTDAGHLVTSDEFQRFDRTMGELPPPAPLDLSSHGPRSKDE